MGVRRRYHIHEAVGRGAFGTVYRATLIGEGGFQKDVAVKILHEKAIALEGVVARLRDEARLLGRVRHRAILQVDGLVHIGGRWALVTEFVDGCSLLDALRAGKVPASVAIEIVGEIAGALHVAYHSTSSEGTPLHLVHRDVKPANVQITSAGEVKLLDFGIAHANFEERESETQSLVLGTPGYMSPERFEGRTGPEADVYALAVLMCELVIGKRVGRTFISPEMHLAHVTKALDEALAADPAFAHVRALAELMTLYDPTKRPTAKEVERMCRSVRAAMPGPGLMEWTEARVPALIAARAPVGDDTLSGDILVEGDELEDETAPPIAEVKAAGTARAVLGFAIAGVGLVVALVLVGGAATGSLLGAAPPAHAPIAPSTAPDAVIATALPPPPTATEPVILPDLPAATEPHTAAVSPPPVEPPPKAIPPEDHPKDPHPAGTSSTASGTAAPAQAGRLVTAREFAAWLKDHPEWTPETAVADGRADENYLWGWKDGVPPDPASPAVSVSYGAADAMCRSHGGLAPVDALPAAWDDTASRMMEWRVADGKPSWLQYDGKSSAKVRRADANQFTAFRCAR